MIYDISPPLSSRIAVWPGDSPLTREVLLDTRRGDAITLSTLRATAHLGAHADAPSHYGAGAPAIAERPLDLYLGPCQVMHVGAARGVRITPAMLPDPVRAPRVLTANTPKSRSSTRSPRARAAVMVFRIVLTIFSTSRWYRCGFSAAICSISSDLIIGASSCALLPVMVSYLR